MHGCVVCKMANWDVIKVQVYWYCPVMEQWLHISTHATGWKCQMLKSSHDGNFRWDVKYQIKEWFLSRVGKTTTKMWLWRTPKRKKRERERHTNLYCFKPAWLLYLVIDDRLVLIDPLISSSGEDHILDREDGDAWNKLSDNTAGYQVALAYAVRS